MTERRLTRRETIAACGLSGVAAVGGVSIFAAADPPPVQGAWPLGRGDAANTGATGAGGPTGSISVRWTFDEHLVARKAPVVADGRLFVGTFDDRASFVALDAATGREDWRADLGDGIGVRFPESSAAVAGDTVVAAFGSVLAGFDVATGGVRWKLTVGGDRLRAPVVVDGTAYVAVGETGSVVALDPSTGEPTWRRSIGEWIPAQVAVADGTVFAVGNRGRSGSLVALDAATGDHRWVREVGRPLATPPAVADGVVYVADGGALHALSVGGSHRFQFDFETPTDTEVHNWSYGGGSAPAIGDGTIFVGAPDDRVYAVDAATGEREWAFWTWNDASGEPVVAGDTVYVASDDSFVYGLDAAEGTRRWEFDTTGPVQGAGGAVVDGLLYVSTWQDGLYALEGT